MDTERKKVTIGTRFHLVMTRDYLKKSIIKDGSKKVLNGFNGTDKEAIDAINKSIKEYYPIGQCNNQDALGNCLGHRY